MAPTYITCLDGLDEGTLAEGFFEGWACPPSRSQHLRILRGSTHVALAIDDDRVVGFANALSDGVMAAYIPLLEVLSDHRGIGIGSRLVELLLELIGPLYMVDVMCDEGVMPFYEQLGFQRSGGAVRRNYRWNSD